MASTEASPKAILAAARAADREELERLLRAGGDPNAQYRGYRPLHALIQERPHGAAEPSPEHLACFVWLLGHGADPELLGAWPPARALVIAAFEGARPFVRALLERGVRRDGFTACALGELDAVRGTLARDRGLATARDGGVLTALQCAAGSGMGRDDPEAARSLLAVLAALLDAGADPNALSRSWSHDVDAAYFACGRGDAARLALLLERGADATAAVVSAAWTSHPELVDLCLAHGARVDAAVQEGKPLLNQLVRWGQVAPALHLLARGASPDVRDERGWTAVHQAASRGNARMLAACLEAGGDRTARDAEGSTPLDVARVKRRPAILALLGG